MTSVNNEDSIAVLLHQLTLVIRNVSRNRPDLLEIDRSGIIFNANELMHDIANFYLGHFDKNKIESQYRVFRRKICEIDERYGGQCDISRYLEIRGKFKMSAGFFT